MEVPDFILDKTGRQRYALVKLFRDHPTQLFTRREVVDHLVNDDAYNKILTRSDQQEENPFCSGGDSGAIPTILIDRLKELVKEEVIEFTKNGKELSYKLKRNLGADPFDENNFSQKDYQELLRWKASFNKYRELPYAELLETLDERSRREFNFGNGQKDLFTIVDFETPFVKDIQLRERIKDLYYAIYDKQYISMIPYQGHYYSNRQPENIRLKDFMPYVLKESRGQWYVAGKCPGDTEFRVVPVNRITSNLKIDQDREFTREPFDPDQYWNGCVGITRIGSPLTVSFRVKNGKLYNNIDYIRTVPIVDGHQIIKIEGEWMKVTLERIFMGPELVREIRSFGKDNIRDVKPSWLEEDLWEEGKRENIVFSILFRDGDDLDAWRIDAEKQLRMESKGENAEAVILIKKSLNKKDWYQVTLKNVLVNSVLHFFVNKLLHDSGDKRVNIKKSVLL